MYRIIKIGMDVHSKNYTLCAMEPTIGAEDRIFGEVQVAPDYKEVICFIESLKMKLGFYDEYSIECGYEAGCLGYTLYHQLTGAGIKCVILAPTTMLTQQGNRIKTDKRDARLIAQCLSYGGYHPVYILILSRLVDTFFSKISLTMPPAPKSHNTAYVLPWEEPLHWQSRSSGYSSS